MSLQQKLRKSMTKYQACKSFDTENKFLNSIWICDQNNMNINPLHVWLDG